MAMKSKEQTAIHYRKRLEGVKPTPELLELLERSLQRAPSNNALRERKDQWIPIPLLRAMQQVLEPHDRERLEQALQQTSLVFTPKPPPPTTLTKEQEEYRKRLERLALQHEERRYTELTSNVNKAPAQDDVTTRSMTYAASVGLNMIIAPLSFGCFMYFFAGGLLDYFLESDSSKSDRKRVIIGDAQEIETRNSNPSSF
ncbi:hypothetical protein FisN_12Lh125 [Fistulifera solaris]|uniref:Transmembrane protein n=1 Tax=Fistulifera solaris TaxID=1519565 RepID=A0A1Z5JN06_FISSO|nr:hypothetical protein FisN_12Lh125 [Fistulifera solaris]|eukprot:GAX15171.1 hypothetical protein FisN_12Lh125 [Fistulifera solaris]